MPPPMPPPRPESADAFFQSFDVSSPGRVGTAPQSHQQHQQQQPPPQQQQQQRRGPPPVGPPKFRPPSHQTPQLQSLPQPRPPPRPPPPASQLQSQSLSQSSIMMPTGNADAGTVNAYSAGNYNTSNPRQPTTAVPLNNSYYGAPSQQQKQNRQPVLESTAATINSHAGSSAPGNSNNASISDWYTPAAASSGPYGAATMMTGGPQSHVSHAMPQAQAAYNIGSAASIANNASTPRYTMEGTMDTSGRGGTIPSSAQPTYPTPQTFVPDYKSTSSYPSGSDYNSPYYSDKDEPSLLEEVGVNVEHILAKTKAVVVPFRRFQKQSALADPSMIVEDADLAGPIAFALLLGGELMLAGKLQFGYIYGFGLFGCFSTTVILNLMSPSAVSFWTVTSILGYALIPVNVLAAVKILLFSFGSTLIRFLAVMTVLWSTVASTRLLEVGCGMEHQRYLLAYPIALLYSAFVLITIF